MLLAPWKTLSDISSLILSLRAEPERSTRKIYRVSVQYSGLTMRKGVFAIGSLLKNFLARWELTNLDYSKRACGLMNTVEVNRMQPVHF